MQSVATQKKYQIRAVQLIAQAKKEQGTQQLTAHQIALWLIANNQKHYSKSTWRQYRAALVYVFTQHIQTNIGNINDLVAAIILLQQTTPPTARPEHLKTSAQKQKKINEVDLIRLMDYFNGKPSRHG